MRNTNEKKMKNFDIENFQCDISDSVVISSITVSAMKWKTITLEYSDEDSDEEFNELEKFFRAIL